MTCDVLSYEELENIVQNYETVFVLAYLNNSGPSDRARIFYDELSRQVINARFLAFDATTTTAAAINKKLGIKYCPMVFAYKHGSQLKNYVGEVRDEIEAVIRSAAVLEKPEVLSPPALVMEPLS